MASSCGSSRIGSGLVKDTRACTIMIGAERLIEPPLNRKFAAWPTPSSRNAAISASRVKMVRALRRHSVAQSSGRYFIAPSLSWFPPPARGEGVGGGAVSPASRINLPRPQRRRHRLPGGADRREQAAHRADDAGPDHAADQQLGADAELEHHLAEVLAQGVDGIAVEEDPGGDGADRR